MTTVTRISTAQRYDSLLDAIQQNKGDVARAEAEIATGLKGDVFADSAGKSGLSLQLRGRKEVVDSYITTNAMVSARQETAASLLGDIGDQVSTVRNLLLQTPVVQSTPGLVAEAARAALENMVTSLNTSFGGIYLFSGAATDVPPYAAQAAGGYAYQGDTTGQLQAQIDDGVMVNIAPRGDAAALTATIAALSALADADYAAMTPVDTATFFAARLADLGTGIDGMLALEGALGNAQARVANTIATQKVLSLRYNNTIIGLEGVDPEEAALKLKEAQTRLDSTYAVTAQLANLSLLNHI